MADHGTEVSWGVAMKRMLVLAGCLVMGTVGVTAPASAATTVTTLAWCSSGATAPCLESVAATPPGGSPTTYTAPANWFGVDVTAYAFDDGRHQLQAKIVQPVPGGFPPDADWGEFAITVDAGSVDYVSVLGQGDDLSFATATSDDGHHHLTLVGSPTRVFGSCSSGASGWSCPVTATIDTQALWFFADDRADEPARRDAYRGFLFQTNAWDIQFPPLFRVDPDSGNLTMDITIPMVAQEESGTAPAVFHGKSWMPYSLLKASLLVDDPTALDPGSVQVGVTGSVGGTYSLTQDPAERRMVVTWSGVRRSDAVARASRAAAAPAPTKLRVRFTNVKPTRPASVTATRVAARKGKVAWAPATSRGFKVRGYRVQCSAVGVRGDKQARTVSATTRSLRVTGLTPGRRYTCTVKATSRFRAGTARSDTMPRRP